MSETDTLPPFSPVAPFAAWLKADRTPAGNAVPELVAVMLQQAHAAAASDVHLCPTADGLLMKWRLDGVLQEICTFSPAWRSPVVTRLKVLADLLTYQTETPQEGRIRQPAGESILSDMHDESGEAASLPGELRLSVFPTMFGEKAVVRLFAAAGRYLRLSQLGLPANVQQPLQGLLGETGGVLLICGPSGSGKTTTAYAALREIVAASGGARSVVTLEDPVETIVTGAEQSQVRPHQGFDFATGLKSILRQDPDVILVGEIRDRETAETVFQAALSGHLVITTFHAGSTAEALGRLQDMDVEPYLLRSGLRAVLCQRLIRRCCDECVPTDAQTTATACPCCRGTGYAGRMMLTEFLTLDERHVGPAILRRDPVPDLEKAAVAAGLETLLSQGRTAVHSGETTLAELVRVLGSAAATVATSTSAVNENSNGRPSHSVVLQHELPDVEGV